MLQNIEACEWLTNALRGLEAPNLDPSYANMRAVCPLAHFFLSDSFSYFFISVVLHHVGQKSLKQVSIHIEAQHNFLPDQVLDNCCFSGDWGNKKWSNYCKYMVLVVSCDVTGLDEP